MFFWCDRFIIVIIFYFFLSLGFSWIERRGIQQRVKGPESHLLTQTLHMGHTPHQASHHGTPGISFPKDQCVGFSGI